MSDFYSRVGSASLKKEVTPATAVIPDKFFGINEESVATLYPLAPAQPVASNRTLNLRPVKKGVPAPTGSLKLNIEPKMWGHFVNGVFGGVTSGNYLPYVRRLFAGVVTGTPALGATLLQATSLATGKIATLVTGNAYFDLNTITGAFDSSHLVTGTNPDATTFTFTPSAILNGTPFTVGETITGGSSSKTATVVLDTGDFLVVSSPSGNFTALETITGGTSSAVSTAVIFDSTVYAHVGTLPQNSLQTYTVQLNFADIAVRYMGCRFNAMDSVGQSDNILTADVKMICQQEFREAKVTAITASGSGSKTITVDQTLGLVATDTIKLYRTGSGFLDFSASTVKTHAVGAVVSTTTFTVTNLQSSIAVGDLILLAPQTPSYTVGNEMPWIGGTFGQMGDTTPTLITSNMEDFTFTVDNMFEERHAATGNLPKDRFPSAIIQKGLTAKGSFKMYYQNEDFYKLLRLNTKQAFRIRAVGDLIGATGMNNEAWFELPNIQLDPFQTSIAKDAVVEQAVPFTAYYDSVRGYAVRAVLITDVASY